MKQIPLTQGLYAIVDDEDFELLSKYKWGAHKGKKTFYAVRQEKVNGKKRNIFMHRQLLGISEKGLISDHINRNGLDNTKANLRACSITENNRNAGKNAKNKCGFKGVFWDIAYGKYRVQISVDGRRTHIGRYDCLLEAAKAYNAAAVKYHGEFANLNQIPENAIQHQHQPKGSH